MDYDNNNETRIYIHQDEYYNSKSINLSVCSTKKTFLYDELLKIDRNTPKSQMNFLLIHNSNSFYDDCVMGNDEQPHIIDDYNYENTNTNGYDNNLVDLVADEPTTKLLSDIEFNNGTNFISAIDPKHSSNDHNNNNNSSILTTATNTSYNPIHNNNICNIDKLVKDGDYAISLGVLPQRIHRGSSGSYFVKNIDEHVIAVFKPKNEEPYGKLNPKWLKWMHKTCLPCCFGRSCIIPNQGYLSEVGASIVDNYLGTNIVPKTTLAWLSSPTFNYSRIDRSNLKAKRLLTKSMPNSVCKKFRCELPPKVGSYQQFLHDYSSSNLFLYKMNDTFIESKLGKIFLKKFQRMTILDYFIRNTDRGSDNWLIKLKNSDIIDQPHLWNNFDDDDDDDDNHQILLAAIDNGLAFPFKHPDSWRSYPFLWAWLPCAKIPYLECIKETFLPKLTSLDSIDDLVSRLHALFSIDKGFSELRFDDQMAVMKGQVYNICNAFRNNMSPIEMVKLTPIYIRSQEAWECGSISTDHMHKKQPLFSCI